VAGGDAVPKENDRYRRDLGHYRDIMLTWLRRLEVPEDNILVEHLAEEGDVIERIVRTAKDKQCDLIVMGTHGSTGDERALLGSVAEAVSRQASCPVLTVRLPAPKEWPRPHFVPSEAAHP
jgi:hypothetical protein